MPSLLVNLLIPITHLYAPLVYFDHFKVEKISFIRIKVLGQDKIILFCVSARKIHQKQQYLIIMLFYCNDFFLA